MFSPPKGHVLAMSACDVSCVTSGRAADDERNSPCVNAKLTPASQLGILHCVDTQASTLARISP
jgi:hypothetical protein